jgi:protein-serine/threonine kinase
MATERRNFSSLSFTKKHSGDTSGTHTPTSTKLKNFFRINSGGSQTSINADGLPTPKTETKPKQSRFLPGLSRNRSTTVASEGTALDDTVSPTAHANPYFAHQGPPALRHHNEGSVPPSPPDTPKIHVNGTSPTSERAITAGKEELARKLRRVASAPNAQGMFANSQSKPTDDRPGSAQLGKEPVIVENGVQPKLSMVGPDPIATAKDAGLAKIPTPGQIRQSVAFRRTYSSNSIKVRNVEVGPGSFDKIKLIGKGDVGKVYLVREKKSNRLYAMKGTYVTNPPRPLLTPRSLEQERNDQKEQDQTSFGRTRNLGHEQSSFHRYFVPFVPVR